MRLWSLGDGVWAAEVRSDFGLDCDWFVMAGYIVRYLKPREELLETDPNHALKSLYIGKN